MVEKIIERCLEDGTFVTHDEGKLYCISEKPKINCVTGTVEQELGLHTRPAATIVRTAQKLGIDAYIIDVVRQDYSKTNSIIGILALCIKQGHRIAVAADNAVDPSRLMELYRTVVEYSS